MILDKEEQEATSLVTVRAEAVDFIQPIHFHKPRAFSKRTIDLSFIQMKEIYAVTGPREPLGTPVRNPLRNRRWTSLRCFIRPVPVVLRRFAFSLQLSVKARELAVSIKAGYPCRPAPDV